MVTVGMLQSYQNYMPTDFLKDKGESLEDDEQHAKDLPVEQIEFC